MSHALMTSCTAGRPRRPIERGAAIDGGADGMDTVVVAAVRKPDGPKAGQLIVTITGCPPEAAHRHPPPRRHAATPPRVRPAIGWKEASTPSGHATEPSSAAHCSEVAAAAVVTTTTTTTAADGDDEARPLTHAPGAGPARCPCRPAARRANPTSGKKVSGGSALAAR